MNRLNHMPRTTQFHTLLDKLNMSMDDATLCAYRQQAESHCVQKLCHAARLEHIAHQLPSHDFESAYAALKSAAHQFITPPSEKVWCELKSELLQSIEYETLQNIYRNSWMQKLRQRVLSSKHHDFFTWLFHEVSTHERYQLLEQWGSVGHPYHPNAKAKIGFNLEENFQFSPEFEANFKIYWLKINPHHIQHYTYDGESILGNLFKDQNLIPVHPWQLKHIIQPKFAKQIAHNQIVKYASQTQVHPTMSFRTVILNDNPDYHIKLSTAVHTTSALRTVSPSSAYNGPKISRILKYILTKEQYFSHTLDVLYDIESGHYCEESTQQDWRHLSYIVRQSPIQKVQNDQCVVPLATLFVASPISQKPLLLEIIDNAACSPIQYFQDYCYKLLYGQFLLYVKYGIALEAHQQNTLLVFNQTKYSHHINRDLGGIRVMPSQLEQHGYQLSLHHDSIISTHSQNELRNKFIHANLQSNIAYWIKTLSTFYAIEPKQLWAIVRASLDKITNELSNSKALHCHAKKELNAILNLPWQQKSLLTMRIFPDATDCIHNTIDNPLASQQ